jgi:hypothetical protein
MHQVGISNYFKVALPLCQLPPSAIMEGLFCCILFRHNLSGYKLITIEEFVVFGLGLELI